MLNRIRKHAAKIDIYLVLAVILLILLIFSVATRGLSSFSFMFGPEKEIIFLNPARCSDQSRCDSAKKIMIEVSDAAGFDLKEYRYEQSTTPGYVILYNNSALVSAYVMEDAFMQQVCGFTDIKEVCVLAQSGK